jgi:hypothetical protein
VISGLVNPDAGNRLQAEGAVALIDAPAYVFLDRGTGSKPSRLVVFNELVFGKNGLREDTTPAALSTEPRLGCQRLGCNVPGTQRHSGGTLPAPVCVTIGDLVTNGSLSDPSDDDNPNLDASRKWYGVSDGAGTKPPHLRYISEVWVSPKQRGGSACRPAHIDQAAGTDDQNSASSALYSAGPSWNGWWP